VGSTYNTTKTIGDANDIADKGRVKNKISVGYVFMRFIALW